MTQHYQVTEAGDPVVSVEDAKTYLKVEHAEDDDLIGQQIASATDECQSYTSKYFAEQDIEIACDLPCEDTIVFDRTPITDIASVVVHNDTTPTTLDASKYTFDVYAQRLVFRDTSVLVGLRDFSPVIVSATAGYVGDGMVPPAVKAAVLARVAETYENRESVPQLSAAVKALLQPYRRIFV